MHALSRGDIKRLFDLLNEDLSAQSLTGELYLVGGAVMCLVFNARATTLDVDAIFEPVGVLREAAAKIGRESGIGEHWLNDAVKGFLSESGTFSEFLDLGSLKVFCAQPEYLLAMKCLAMRLGREFHDEADIRYLLRYLNIESYHEAVSIITRYYPKNRFPQKTLYALEEILGY
ncbi:FIG00551000: hypothetical protein [hydrothermal vent metagenome]|uniref:Uncharacterized protein n=1 Tax=hydrothermal vent metagenome TaxID=652676 RepID=A0A3B1BR62_9ZZZZ